MAADGREICLHYHSKGEFVRQCTRSHAPLRGQIPENLIRYIGKFRDAHDPPRKRKFNGGGKLVSYGVQTNWNRNGGKVHNGQNPDGQAHRSGSGCSFDRVIHIGGVT